MVIIRNRTAKEPYQIKKKLNAKHSSLTKNHYSYDDDSRIAFAPFPIQELGRPRM